MARSFGLGGCRRWLRRGGRRLGLASRGPQRGGDRRGRVPGDDIEVEIIVRHIWPPGWEAAPGGGSGVQKHESRLEGRLRWCNECAIRPPDVSSGTKIAMRRRVG